jgi:hypothetical protein
MMKIHGHCFRFALTYAILVFGPPVAAQEAIAMRGHWTVTVREPDGSVSSRYDFNNHLATGTGAGGAALAQMLSGETASEVMVDIAMTDPGGSSGYTLPSNGELTRAVPTSGPDAGKFVLRGSFRPVTAGTINQVGTRLLLCKSANNCVQRQLTTTTTSPISVLAQQLVEVQVIFSFSTAP